MFWGVIQGSQGAQPPVLPACSTGHLLHCLETEAQTSLILWDELGGEFWQEDLITSFSNGAGGDESL